MDAETRHGNLLPRLLMLPMIMVAIVMITSMLCPAFGQRPPTDSVVEVLSLEKKIEDAVVRGDDTFISSVTAPDFRFTHGDAWIHGGKPLAVDDKAAFLKRVREKEYLVHDLDQVKAELHGDVVITYGRYVSLFEPKGGAAVPGRLNSIWFERVYAKRNGEWQFLSHRTVHGPTISPAGVDPDAFLAK